MEEMAKRLSFSIICAIILIAGSVQSVTADKSESIGSHNDIWIVQLEDEPTVRFEGEIVQGVTADGRRVFKALEATAPGVTGVKKLDVNNTAVQRYVAYLDGERAQVLNLAEQQMGRAMQPRHVYRHVLNGFAVEMSETEARQLAQMPGVKSVEPDYIQYTQMDAGRPWIGTDRYWSGAGGVPGPNRGEGMVLGVVDTGINWNSFLLDNNRVGVTPVTNPRPGFLGLCSDPEVPCSGKLIGVYDFTDGGTKGNDPDGHGTHVATTALGFPVSGSIGFSGGPPIFYSLSGIAPQASLVSYKACVENPDGGNFICRFADTTAALEQAIEDEVDVVNYSIGGPPFSPWAGTTPQVFLNMRAAGIVPVVAAGNDGPVLNSVNSPANAPWVMGVANATHDRMLVNRLTNATGGDFTLGTLQGKANTGGTGILPIVHARDFGHALCGAGPAELGQFCSDNTGASNPFPPGTFNGQIVVCDRGVYGRIEKGRNVQLAGAAGMILANTQAQSESTDSDAHCLPATHIGANDGDRLRDWLDSGANHSGRLAGTIRVDEVQFGGLLNNSSSRGPAKDVPGVMKPNVTAPGTDVVAAVSEVDGESDLVGLLTGTSMASPHVAGAALLLRNSHPDWGVDEVISALETTADATIVAQSDGSLARIIDRGAGGIQVDRAARIGLYLPTSTAEFLGANPATGGVPGNLNLPGIVSDNCLGECSFTRRVRALGNSTWTFSSEGDLDIEVSPASFTLSAGQEQTLTVTIRPGSAPIGDWGAGSVVLESSNTQFITQRLPVGAFVSGGIVPDFLSFASERNRGRGTLLIEDAVALPETLYRTSALVRPEQVTVTLRQDPTANDPYDGGNGVFVQNVNVPNGALLLHVETFSSEANDVDLYVGRDLNGNDLPEEEELVCESTTFTDLERCLIRQPLAGNWWILVQNWNDSAPGANDRIPFEFAVLGESDDPSLVVSGLANHLGGDLELPVYWDQPAMLQNERWLGAIGIASSPDDVANVGVVPVRITRTGENTPQVTPLFEGRTESVVIPPGTEHNALFIDVPAGATSLNVTADGALDSLAIRFASFDDVNELFDANLANVNTVANGTENNGVWTATVTPGGPNGLQAGRYVLSLENASGQESLVAVTANVEEPIRIEPGIGLYSPRDRLIFQGFQWGFGGGNAFIIWYTFDEDGLPTFYLSGSEPPDPQSSYYTAPLFRFTSNGERQTADQVGEIQIVALSDTLVSYAWMLNGTRNAELQIIANGQDCPLVDGRPQPYQGLWFPDGVREGGASVLATENVEIWIRYYFDEGGQPRWVFGDGLLEPTLPGGKRLRVDEYRGFCIYCDEEALSFTPVGVMERQFESLTMGREVVEFQSLPPLSQNYSTDRPVTRLTSIGTCSN